MMEMLKWGAEGTPNELMPRAASRRRRDQLVARLETLHTPIPNAEESMAKAPFNHSQSAPAIEPPIDRRCARAAEHPPRRLSPTAGNWGFRDASAKVSTRQKDIQYSSRTRAGTDSFKRIQRLRRAAADLLEKLPDDLRRSPEAALLRNVGDRKVYNIVHLIYRAKNYEGPAKDYEFSHESMEEHWRAGYYDAVRTLRHPEVVGRPANDEGVFTFDLAVDGRE